MAVHDLMRRYELDEGIGDRPGFTTLGNPYLPNDKRELRLLGTYRLLKGRLAGSASLGTRSDNLAGDKRGTTTRRTGAFGMTVISGSWLVSSVSVLLNGLTRDPPPLAPGTPDPGTCPAPHVFVAARV